MTVKEAVQSRTRQLLKNFFLVRIASFHLQQSFRWSITWRVGGISSIPATSFFSRNQAAIWRLPVV